MVCDKVDENISCYYGIYAEIVKVIGADKMKAFYEIVKGQQIVFPMKLYSKEYIVSIAQSGERNINELWIFGTLFPKDDCGKCRKQGKQREVTFPVWQPISKRIVLWHIR